MQGKIAGSRQVLAALCFFGALTALPAAAQDTNGIIVYQTDFGLKDGAVSAMRGVAIVGRPDLAPRGPDP